MGSLKRYWLSSIAIVIGLLIGGHAGASESIRERDRALYVEALKAYRANNIHEFDLIRQKISLDYPLQPYLEQMRIEANLLDYSIWDIRAFVTKHKDTPIGQSLESQWITLHAKNKDWDDITPFINVKDPAPRGCYALRAALAAGESIETFQNRIESLWNVGFSQPKACDDVFEQWQASGYLTQALLQKRIIKAVSNENRKLAQHLSTLLEDGKQKRTIEQWLHYQKHPLTFTNDIIKEADTVFRDDMAVNIYKELTDADPLIAKTLFKDINDIKWRNLNTLTKIQQTIALHLALDADVDSEQWIESLPKSARTTAIQEWRVRQAMKRHDWPGVIRAIEAMSNNLAELPQWQYWLGTAYRTLGSDAQAEQLYQNIAPLKEYYGYLASYRLGLPISVKQIDVDVDPALIVGISALPGVERANELIAVNQLLDARKEWYFVIDRLPLNKRLAAARLASRMGWHHFSLYAVHHVKDQADLSLQFPLGNENIVTQQAVRLSIDPAWIFSIAHQESHFKKDAKSSRGAIGLMQILPETAARVAGIYNLPYGSQWSLVEEETNISLGSSYLHHLLDNFSNHIILATAAYNAGPSKVEEWLPDNPTEADLWVETIPFYETRGYLKKVLANLMIYRQMLGKSPDIESTFAPVYAALVEDKPDTGNRI